MPQLDLLTFLPQFTWFALFFTLFYFRVVTVFLPKLAATLKIRKKAKEQNARNRAEVGETTQQEITTFEQRLKDNLKITQNALVIDRAGFNTASEQAFTLLNKTDFTKSNKTYTKAIAATVLAEHVLLESCNPQPALSAKAGSKLGGKSNTTI